MSIKIQKAGLIDTVLEIYLDAYKGLEKYAYKSRGRAKKYLKWLARRDSEGIFLAFLENRPAGFIALDRFWRPGCGEIHELCVKQDMWSKGVGTALIEHTLSIFRKVGFQKAGLWVGEGNERAISFYRKFEFKPVSRYFMWIRMERQIPL